MRCVPKILLEIRGPIFVPVVGSVNQTKLAVNLSEDEKQLPRQEIE